MRLVALLLFVSLPAFAVAKAPAATGAPAIATRGANAQEIGSFARFYAQTFPDAQAVQPVFSVTRPRGNRQWRVAASVDAAPLRATAPLCRMGRSHFAYDPTVPKDRWSRDGQDTDLVWLGREAGCVAPPQPVRLTQPIPDADVIRLLQQQTALLARARLLWAGNTECSALRSLPFTLGSIEPEPAASGKAAMTGLVFQSDRGSAATVWIKKTGRELTAWRANCAAPAPPAR